MRCRTFQPDFVIGVNVCHQTLSHILEGIEKTLIVSIEGVRSHPAELDFICSRSFHQIKGLPPFRLIHTLVFGYPGFGTSTRIADPAFGEVELEIDQGEPIAPAKAGKHSYLAVLNLAHTSGPLALHTHGGFTLFEKAGFVDE